MSQAQVTADQFLDPRWRLCNLYTIKDKDGRVIPFRPNWAQQQFIEQLHLRNIILKARQRGLSTLVDLILLDQCVFLPHQAAQIIAHTKKAAETIFTNMVEFPYQQLDEGIRNAVGLQSDRSDRLEFTNGSSLVVATSARGATLQGLHVSEFGKVCATYPHKAREIVTGAIEAVAAGGFVAIESTAEGQEGAFFEMVQRSRKLEGRDLSALDYKFHFYSWYDADEYRLPPDLVTVPKETHAYLDGLEAKLGVRFDPGQRAWYAQKDADLGGDMKREYPTTPDEAFEQSLEGCYFEHQLQASYRHKRVGAFPLILSEPVNTFWDLGRNDLNTIWLHQFHRGRHRWIGYYENSGEHLSHYARWLNSWAADNNAVFGKHYAPHDGDRQDLYLEHGRDGVAQKAGLRFEYVARPASKIAPIEATRGMFALFDFDEESCSVGLKRLSGYRKEYDERREVYRSEPRHDINSHGAEAFMLVRAFQAPAKSRGAASKRRKRAKGMW